MPYKVVKKLLQLIEPKEDTSNEDLINYVKGFKPEHWNPGVEPEWRS